MISAIYPTFVGAIIQTNDYLRHSEVPLPP